MQRSPDNRDEHRRVWRDEWTGGPTATHRRVAEVV